MSSANATTATSAGNTTNTASTGTNGDPAQAAQPAPPALVTRQPVAFNADDPVALYMDTGVFGQLQRVAKLMCSSALVPEHLRGEARLSDCFLVAAQAFRWRMDPFSVAQHTYVVSGKLGYEGKLIAGLVNASGRLEENLRPEYFGDKGSQGRGVRIVGRLKGTTTDREVEGTVAQWKTNNGQWTTGVDQMLWYRGAREWARRHMPEIMLGIVAEEELDVTTLAKSDTGRFEARKTLESFTEHLAATKPEPIPVVAQPVAVASTAPVIDAEAKPADATEPAKAGKKGQKAFGE